MYGSSVCLHTQVYVGEKFVRGVHNTLKGGQKSNRCCGAIWWWWVRNGTGGDDGNNNYNGYVGDELGSRRSDVTVTRAAAAPRHGHLWVPAPLWETTTNYSRKLYT